MFGVLMGQRFIFNVLKGPLWKEVFLSLKGYPWYVILKCLTVCVIFNNFYL